MALGPSEIPFWILTKRKLLFLFAYDRDLWSPSWPWVHCVTKNNLGTRKRLTGSFLEIFCKFICCQNVTISFLANKSKKRSSRVSESLKHTTEHRQGRNIRFKRYLAWWDIFCTDRDSERQSWQRHWGYKDGRPLCPLPLSSQWLQKGRSRNSLLGSMAGYIAKKFKLRLNNCEEVIYNA